MKKLWDKFRGIFRINRRLLFSLFVLSLIGVVAGSLLVTFLSDGDRALTNQYLTTYFQNIQTSQIDFFSLFQNILFSNTLTVVAIWLLGISVIGIPIILVIFFAKTFVLGFSIASLFSMYHWKGILYAIAYIFPHHILNLLIYMILIIYAFAFSTKLIHALCKKENLDVKNMRNKYLLVLGVTVGTIVITSLFETFLTPYLMKLVLTIFK